MAILKNLFSGEPGKTAGMPDAEPLPAAQGSGSKTNASSPPGAPGSARASVPLFGGNRGGRKRKDGLKPGSPEAVRADKERDRERKRNERSEAAAVVDAPPLPAGPAVVHPMPAQTVPVAGVPGPDGFAPDVVVRWQAKDVEKLVRQFIALTEELCTKSISDRCHKAKLPAAVIEKLESDAAWAESAKRMIEEGGSELAAKYLNEANISPELKPFILISIGAMQIAVNHQQVLKRLDALIASQQKQP